MDTFRVFLGVHFMHTICRFEAREIRSPTLKTVHELESNRRSYGCLKTTTSSYAKFRNCEMSCETHFGTRVPFRSPCLHLRSCEPRCEITSKLWNHLQVVISPPSCKTKVQTCKMDNSTCESPCEIHLCKLRYLQPT